MIKPLNLLKLERHINIDNMHYMMPQKGKVSKSVYGKTDKTPFEHLKHRIKSSYAMNSATQSTRNSDDDNKLLTQPSGSQIQLPWQLEAFRIQKASNNGLLRLEGRGEIETVNVSKM